MNIFVHTYTKEIIFRSEVVSHAEAVGTENWPWTSDDLYYDMECVASAINESFGEGYWDWSCS
jgi:hypothetical protein